MLDFVKQLFESNVISEETKSEIEAAWESKIQENREQAKEQVREEAREELLNELRESMRDELRGELKEEFKDQFREEFTSELREEFAQKYEHDKGAMVEAVENMLADRLQVELSEFAEDRQGLIEARANYVKKMKQDSQAMESFVLQNLKKELTELHEDRKSVADNMSKLESFIVDALAKEIAEFHNDKKDLAETKVRLIRESREKFNQLKKEFITKSASVVKETVNRGLEREMSQLKEDIEHARKNDFGRRLFESFASEYASSFFSEKSETAKLMKVVSKKDQELEQAAKLVAESQQLVESVQAQLKVAKDIANRKEIMGELLNPLSGEKRAVMKQLLESVQTDRLRTAYDKYLPSVMDNGIKSKKEALVESKEPEVKATEITGDKPKAQPIGGEEKTAEIFDIRRLAGLKV
jgi:hypothetical protein